MNKTETTQAPKTVCKFRGITLNYTASQLVNTDVIKIMISKKGPDEVVTVYTDRKIKRKRKGGRALNHSQAEEKIYRVSFFKDRRLHDNNSVLFRYCADLP